jgi:hypothetical protein
MVISFSKGSSFLMPGTTDSSGWVALTERYGTFVTGSAGRIVKLRELFEGTEFFRRKIHPA